MITADFVIIGAGVIGLTIALEIRLKYPNSKIIIIEKEKEVGLHASGRNSGVLHAGFYYTKDSMKAQFTKEGNFFMKEFCKENDIPINHCGKLVMARNENEMRILDELFQRGKNNNIELIKVTKEEVKEIEPLARLSTEYAMFSPTTASVSPVKVMNTLKERCKEKNIDILYNTNYFEIKNQLSYGFIFNCAGLYVDKIATDLGLEHEFAVLPFKGVYLEEIQISNRLKTNIYPVPNIENPFLGVHFTIKENGAIKLGPTALPCFWNENYSIKENFILNEFGNLLKLNAIFFSKFKNIKFAINEIKYLFKSNILKECNSFLLQDFKISDFKYAKPGIRAQIFNKKTKSLEMDFIFQKHNNQMHLINAVSPAFTCSFAIAKFVVAKI